MQNKQCRSRWFGITTCGILCTIAMIVAGSIFESHAARQPRSQRDTEDAQAEYAAKRLLKTGQDLLLANETERGVEVLKKVIDQFPESDVRFEAYLALGKHLIDINKQQQAIGYLNYLRELEDAAEPPAGETLNILLEGLFLTGKAYFQMRQYSSAFPVLRKITNTYPNTVWANEAYYVIGKSHFAQENWNMAIEALSKVGTYIDPDSPTTEYVEAGRRFYVKIADGDLPVRYRLNEKIFVDLSTRNGDEVRIEVIPMAGDSDVFIGSVPTAIGKPIKSDRILQVVGGDEIHTKYVDDNTLSGDKTVNRSSTVKIVSTATLGFTRGDMESRAEGAYIGQPVFVVLRDIDLDSSDAAETTTVRIICRYKAAEEEGARSGETFDLASFLRDSSTEDDFQIRDEITIVLNEHKLAPSALETEMGEQETEVAAVPDDGTVRTGIFAGRVEIVPISDDRPVSKNDDVISATVGDEIVVTYIDELHIDGEAPREVSSVIMVLSEIESTPRATQYIVSDPIIRSKKNLVEGEAYLELGRIFKSMGLRQGAAEKCDEGLALVESIIRSGNAVPRASREEAFRLKWELEIVKDDFTAAINTCRLFNRLYPHSPIVDQALLGIANAKAEGEKYDEAIGIYKQILALPHSQAKPQAQYMVAEAMEKIVAQRGSRYHGFNKDAAIAQYKLVAERYPDSEYAGPSLGKLVDYYIESRDYSRADDLLHQVFTDHPDALFLDSMLLKWVLVAYRMQDYPKALEKCNQLMYDYPTSDFAEKAKQILPRIQQKVK